MNMGWSEKEHEKWERANIVNCYIKEYLVCDTFSVKLMKLMKLIPYFPLFHLFLPLVQLSSFNRWEIIFSVQSGCFFVVVVVVALGSRFRFIYFFHLFFIGLCGKVRIFMRMKEGKHCVCHKSFITTRLFIFLCIPI